MFLTIKYTFSVKYPIQLSENKTTNNFAQPNIIFHFHYVFDEMNKPKKLAVSFYGVTEGFSIVVLLPFEMRSERPD